MIYSNIYKPLRFPINVVYNTFSFINYYLERLRQGHDRHSPYGVFWKRISDIMGVDKQIIASSYILNFFPPPQKNPDTYQNMCVLFLLFPWYWDLNLDSCVLQTNVTSELDPQLYLFTPSLIVSLNPSLYIKLFIIFLYLLWVVHS